MDRVRFEPGLDAKVTESLGMLEDWFSKHPGAFVSVSGGKDSIVTMDLVRRVCPTAPVVFYDSGLEFPQNLRYLARLDERYSLGIVRIPAVPSALEVMAESGAWEHGAAKKRTTVSLQEALIDRPAAEAKRRWGSASVYGLRADESKARRRLLVPCRGHVVKHESDGSIRYEVLAPIWRWSDGEVLAYLQQRKIPVNPLYAAQERLGVPQSRARVGTLIEGNAIEKGRWAIARRLAPDLCRQVEVVLPALRDLR